MLFITVVTLLHSERPKLYGVLAVLSAIGLIPMLPKNVPTVIDACIFSTTHRLFYTGKWQYFRIIFEFKVNGYTFREATLPFPFLPLPAV